MSVCLSLCPSISIETTCGVVQRDCTSGQSNREWPPSDNLKCIQRGTENLHFEIKARRRLKTCWYALQIIPQQVRSRYGEGGAELQKKVILHLNSVHIVFDPWHRKFTLCNLLHRLININIQDQLSTSPKSPQRYAINVSVSLCLIDLMDWAAAAGGFPRLLLLFPSNWKFYSS